MYKEQKEDPVNKLVHEIERVVENNDIAVVAIVKRESEAYYNYKTREVLVIWKPIHVDWENQLIRHVEVFEITAGIYQEYPLAIGEIIEESLKRKGYAVERITIY
jgi:hypothetical protein